MVVGCVCSCYCSNRCINSYNLLHIKSNFSFTVKLLLLIPLSTYYSSFLLKQEKSSLNESSKKTDEPVPDVEAEASDEDPEADIKEDEDVDSKSADDDEENVCATKN